MDDWKWKKRQLLVSQLEFFGCKKIKFISEYAKKPRICIKKKTPEAASNNCTLGDIYQQQMLMGVNRSTQGFNQMAQAQMNMNQSGLGQFGGMQGMSATSQFGGIFGGSFI